MTRTSLPRTDQPLSGRHRDRRWGRRLCGSAASVALAGGLAAVSTGAAQAQAQPHATTHATTTATVVKVVTRAPFGKMLATVHGRSLYVKPVGSCGPACLGAWPPLLMPRGTTMPLGARCLGTAKLGHRLQVTYRGVRLYLFVGDSGTSVTGNNLQGFKVAKVKAGVCT